MTHLVLGTAQFGDGYGITNDARRLDDGTVAAILEEAALRGIATFDTAAEYGDAQKRLGQLMPGSLAPKYITKFAVQPGSDAGRDQIFGRSMRLLGVDGLYGVLFHRVSDLAGSNSAEALNSLREARAGGHVRRIGVSVYDLAELEFAVSRFPDLDLVQIPGSLVDQRLIQHPFLVDLHQAGVEVHVRSAFLQGLLLQPSASLDRRFGALQPILAAVDDLADHIGTDRLSLLLGALQGNPNVDAVVVGATSVDELSSTHDAWSALPALPNMELPELPIHIIDPRLW